MTHSCATCTANETTGPRRLVKVAWLKDEYVARLPFEKAIRPWAMVFVCEDCWEEASSEPPTKRQRRERAERELDRAEEQVLNEGHRGGEK